MKQVDRDAKYIGALLHAGKNDAAYDAWARVSVPLMRWAAQVLRDKIHQHHTHLKQENAQCVLT